MIKFGLLLFVLCEEVCVGQPSIQWSKCFGGNDYDFAYSIQQTTDSGFVIAGTTYSFNGDVSGHHGGLDNFDYWVLKIDNSGNIQWQKCLGGRNDDEATSIAQTLDGGYIVAGYSFSNDSDVSGHHGDSLHTDYWVVKLTSSGSIQWQKSLGGSNNEYGYFVQQTFDGGYIVAGNSGSNDGDVSGNHLFAGFPSVDYWVIKLDNNGNIEWQKSLGGSGNDFAYSIQQTRDSGYVVAGYSPSSDGDVSGQHNPSSTDFWVVKIDTIGGIQWEKCLGGYYADWASFCQQTKDGGYIVAGLSGSNDGDVSGNHGPFDYWVVKLDSNSNISWQKCLGGSYDDRALYIQQTNDSGYAITGWSMSDDGDVSGHHGANYYDYWVVKLDDTGNLQWQKSMGGSNGDIAYTILQTYDGGYIVSGIGGSYDGDVVGYHGDSDYWIVKLSPDSFTTNIPQPTMINPPSKILLSPNPTAGKLAIGNKQQAIKEIELYNLLGEKVFATIPNKNEIDISSLPAGIYILQGTNGEEIFRGKVLKE